MASNEPVATTRPPAPRLGEIWLTAFGAARAGEPGKTRPALVLSANGQVSDSVYDLVMVAPLSATLEPTAARPRINATAANGLDTDSVVVARALRAVSTSRLVGRLGVAETAPLHATRQVVAALLDLG